MSIQNPTEDRTESALIGSAEAQKILSQGRPKVVDKATVIRWGRQGRIKIVHQIPGRSGAILYDRESVEKFAAELQAAS